MNFNLKNCPCCGEKAQLLVIDGVYVRCSKCGLSTKHLRDFVSCGRPVGCAVKKVIELWNKRVGDENNER